MKLFAVKTFANCPRNREIRESFHPRKIPAIQYLLTVSQGAWGWGGANSRCTDGDTSRIDEQCSPAVAIVLLGLPSRQDQVQSLHRTEAQVSRYNQDETRVRCMVVPAGGNKR